MKARVPLKHKCDKWNRDLYEIKKSGADLMCSIDIIVELCALGFE